MRERLKVRKVEVKVKMTDCCYLVGYLTDSRSQSGDAIFRVAGEILTSLGIAWQVPGTLS